MDCAVALNKDDLIELVKSNPQLLASLTSPQSAPFKQKKSDRYAITNNNIRGKYDIIRVNDNGTYYYKPKDDPDTPPVYERLDDHKLDNLVRDTYLSSFGVNDPVEWSNAAEMVKRLTMEEYDTISNDLWYVAPRTIWSTEDGELRSTIPDDKPCFRRLFNTKFPDKHVIQVAPFTPEQEKLLWKYYTSTLDELELGVMDEKEEFDFISTWANGNHDVYLDIIRSIAYFFVKKKPVGSYILVGLRRNGKSSFVGLLHTIFGRENTSDVRLSQLGDPHYVNKLKYTMMNAPDEEDERALDAQASFKTIADHGRLPLSVMRSNEPIYVHCDFMCFYPMNHIPDWKGTGAAACMKRSLVIPFYADLSQYDKKNYEFAKETFTPQMMAKFMGYIFAYANYYSRHELDFSVTMLNEQSAMEEEVDSAVTYRRVFEKYFDGFESLVLLYQDYVNWCKAYDLKILTKKELKFVFRDYVASTRKTTRVGQYTMKGYRIPSANKSFFYNRFSTKDVGSVELLHSKDCSMLERLETFYSTKEAEWT